MQKLRPGTRVADREQQMFLRVFLRTSETVNRGDGRDDDHVPAGEERGGRCMPQPIDLGIDLRVLLDIGIGDGKIRFRLVVIVIRDEIVYGVFRKELLIFLRELGGERLVMREHQRRFPVCGDHVRHREGLSGAGHAEKRLTWNTLLQPAQKPVDRLRLIAGRLPGSMEIEIHRKVKWKMMESAPS